MREPTYSGPSFFLQKRLHYYLTLAVIATTLFSWFNLNSYLIILLVLCRLADGGPRATIRAAFTNKYFLACFCIFLLEFAGLFYTHHFFTGWKHVESKATLVAIPFVLCAGPYTDRAGYRRLQLAYCYLLAGICVYCLAMARVEFHWQHDADVFFYHSLTSSISVNAVFFSAYVIVAILFLLYSNGTPAKASGRWSGSVITSRIRIVLILFFTAMMILLSSRLLLALLIVIYLYWLSGQFRREKKIWRIAGVGLLIVMGTGLLAFTDNPVSRRVRDINPAVLQQGMSPAGTANIHFDGVSLRLVMWQYALDILHERKAWVWGVSAGDSQELLDQKYIDAKMSEGYLGYNFHNEYIEVLVRSGLVGAGVFIACIVLLIGLARTAATPAAGYTIAMMLVLFLTESALEMQHALFLFAFFPGLTGIGNNPNLRVVRPMVHRALTATA